MSSLWVTKNLVVSRIDLQEKNRQARFMTAGSTVDRRIAGTFLHQRPDRLAENIDDPVDLIVRCYERRRQTVDVAANSTVETSVAAFFVKLLAHLSGGIEGFLCRLVFDEFKTNEHSQTSYIAHDAHREQLFHALEKTLSL